MTEGGKVRERACRGMGVLTLSLGVAGAGPEAMAPLRVPVVSNDCHVSLSRNISCDHGRAAGSQSLGEFQNEMHKIRKREALYA